ncbi:MAG: hypothetical protein RLZZ282_768 [Verrucomicrobiota bacterium]
MTTDHPISVGIFEGFSWIRYEGKASFVNSPILKAFGDERIAAGESCLVVDLSHCTSMDSTFMGTLAGMATRLASLPGGHLQIADAGERNRRSLEDLGLDFLMEIDPPAAAWLPAIETIRQSLLPPNTPGSPGQIQRARHVLEAHETLKGINDKNARVFHEVVSLLKNELNEKESSPKTEPPPQA